MTKNERIAQLEARVKALEATIAEQAIRIGMLEAQPRFMPYVVPAESVPNRYPPPGPYTYGPQCTCGSTAGCLLHPSKFIS